ncbi:MAG: hypothetical protein E3K36_03380 [Candidatus Brocadia sp.]|nr:hypothetical protein [Candidatus Brocadia sp.]
MKLTYAAESGIVLIAVLALVTVLALVGIVSVVTTNTDIKISSNYKTSVQALYAAQAGTEEARARLRGSSSANTYTGDTAASPNPKWSAYILTSNSWQTSDDPDYNANYENYIPKHNPIDHTNKAIVANSLQTDISYWVKMRHKREYDAEQAGHTTTSLHYDDKDEDEATHTAELPGNIVYYGYEDSLATTAVQFTSNSPLAKYKPVEIITAYGYSGSSLNKIEIEVVCYPGPPIFAPFYSKGGVTINGSSGKFYGTDTCSVNSSLPPIYTNGSMGGGGNPTYTGNPPSPVESGTLVINVEEYIQVMKDNATITITEDQSGTNYGDASNFVTCYANMAELKLNNVTGFGILLVEGDLELGGNFNWNGLILVTGKIKMNGGGTGIIISGAIFSGDSSQTDSTNGQVTVKYDSCEIENALINQPLKVIKWREIY